jgi:hypothetical protein
VPRSKKREPAWTPFVPVSISLDHLPKQLQERVRSGRVLANSLYQVVVREITALIGPLTWLSIKRLDQSACHDWRHLQRIKNDILGPDVEGVELYPAESRLVDASNQFHLWCLPRGQSFGFGFQERLVAQQAAFGAVQRPFEKDQLPLDLVVFDPSTGLPISKKK